MNNLIIYLKHDVNQFINKRTTKIFYIILTVLALIEILSVYLKIQSFNFYIGKSAFSFMFLEGPYSIINDIYFLVLPIIIAFPYSAQYYIERKNNYHVNLIVRGDRKNYLLSKYIMCFIIGFLTIFYFLIINYIFNLLIYPNEVIIEGVFLEPDAGAAFENIFYNNIYLYEFIYILINAFVGGILSLGAFVLSLLFRYRNQFLVISIPFIIYLIQSIFVDFLLAPRYNLMVIIQPRSRFALSVPSNTNSIITTLLIWSFIFTLLFLIGYKREKELI